MEALSDDELRHKTVEFRERLDEGETLDDLLIEAFAVVREAAWRVLGQRHFDVQLMGGMALHFGWIAEMKTGEGKTLVSTLPVYLNALAGEGVHVVTVNDYLATRDAEWMGRLHRWLGLTVGRVGPDVDDLAAKRAAYAADVTYGTNTEFGFDYLRDNMARSREHMVQRGHSFAIVDEVDSILIDEARTPLIISGPADEAARLYYQFASIARTLTRDVDYEVDEEKRTVVPMEAGIEKVERALGVDNLYDAVSTNYVHQLTQALQAKELYHRDKDYMVERRRGEDRRRVHRPHPRGPALVRRPAPGGGGQGAGPHQGGEPHLGHGDPPELLPPLREARRDDRHGRDRGRRVRQHLQPAGGADPDQPADGPRRRARPHLQDRGGQVRRRGRRHRRAPRAGPAGPGRHRLGGEVRGPLRACSRSGASPTRCSTPSSTSGRPRSWPRPAGSARSPWPPTWPAEGSTSSWAATPSCWRRTRSVARGLDLETEEGAGRAAELRGQATSRTSARPRASKVRELGGLYVLGSERHESRRIDNQLRGRSGRQGDPGESRFYLSLEDELMRLFATGRHELGDGPGPARRRADRGRRW